MKILNLDNWCPEATAIVKEVAEVHISKEGIIHSDDVVNYDGIITNLNRFNQRIDLLYQELIKLKFIASCTTGLDHINLEPEQWFKSVKIISLQGETEFLKDVHATSEMTWALIMALIRKLPFAHSHVIEGGWDRESFQGVELRNKTLGIVGYGRVGQQVAKLAEAFGMNVIWIDKNETIYWNKRDRSDGDWDWDIIDLLSESDVVTIHVPFNSETKGMFSYDQFNLMKPTSFFINTSRGAIVDEEALIWALENKIIAGAALDVVQNEPNPWPRLLHYASKHDNLILTPHISGNTAESRKSTQLFVANKIKEYIKNSKESET